MMKQLNQGGYTMNFIKRIMPLVWAIVEKNKKCSANVSTFEDKLTITFLLGKRRKVFTHENDNILIRDLRHFLAA